MSFHRGGPSGVVAVPYTTSTMAPLSPSRRYSSGNSATTIATSNSGIGNTANMPTTAKYTCRAPGATSFEHTSYSPTASSSLITSRKNSYLSARSVVSNSDSVTVTVAGKQPKYSSTSVSSASSTASSSTSSSTSSASRDNRNNYSSIFSKEQYFDYHPDNYIPKIHRESSIKSKTSNGYCKPFSLSTSSLTSGLAELHGGDERDSYRRDKSYSTDISSDRWPSISTSSISSTLSTSCRRQRNNQLNTVHPGHDNVDGVAANSEVKKKEHDDDNNGDVDLTVINNKVHVDSLNVDNYNNNINNHDNLNDNCVENNDNNNDVNNLNNHHGHPTFNEKSRTSTNVDSSSSSSLSSTSPTDSIWISSDSPANETTDNTLSPLVNKVTPIISINEFLSTSGTSAGGGGSVDKQIYPWTKQKIPTNLDNNTELFTNNNDQNCVLSVPIFGGATSDAKDALFKRQASSARVNVRDCAAQWINAGNEASNNQLDSDDDEDEEVPNVDEELKGANKELVGNFRVEASSDISVDKIHLDDDTAVKKSGIKAEMTLLDNAYRDDEFKSKTDVEFKPGLLDDNFRVIGRPTGTQDDTSKPSTSTGTYFGGWDSLNNDYNSATTNSTSQPIDVHQSIYRGFNEQIEESSTSRSPRNRIPARRDEIHGLNGLRNIGNTKTPDAVYLPGDLTTTKLIFSSRSRCFMNSVIQCLSNTRPLLEYLLNEQYLNDINTTTSSMKGALIKAFAQVIHELWGSSGDHAVNTASLKNQIQRFAPRFMGYAQQDAQEFLRYLLEGLHEDVNRVTVKPQPILADIPDHYTDSMKATESWKRYLRSEDSTIVDVFVGQLRSSLHCTVCDHDSVTLDPFWDLSLPIPVRSGTVKLQQCLEHFTKVETLDSDEKPTCSKCQMRRKCTKSFSIQKFPKILVIHLKRFSPTERFRAKLSVLVDFPLEGLDLSAFAAPGVPGCTYNLYGVANHSGTPYSGHYTAYCKHPYSGEWHEYNDSSVSSVSQSSVVSSEGYVLFYEQQPLSHHL